jgi:predicted metal-binding protein
VSAPPNQPVIHVCITCSSSEPKEPRDQRPGLQLFEAVVRLARTRDIDCEVRPVECMAQCDRSCTVAFSSADKWSYIFGDLDPTNPEAPEAILACLDIQARDPDGLIRLRERPPAIRRGLLARIPPFSLEPTS